VNLPTRRIFDEEYAIPRYHAIMREVHNTSLVPAFCHACLGEVASPSADCGPRQGRLLVKRSAVLSDKAYSRFKMSWNLFKNSVVHRGHMLSLFAVVFVCVFIRAMVWYGWVLLSHSSSFLSLVDGWLCTRSLWLVGSRSRPSHLMSCLGNGWHCSCTHTAVSRSSS